MKIIKHNKKLVIETLKIIHKIIKLDNQLYRLTPDFIANNDLCFYDFYGCLDAIYLQLTGEKRNTIHDMFGTPWEKDKINAWLKGDGYIPDQIDHNILSTDIKEEQAYNNIIKYLKMLIKLKKQHESKKTT